MNGLRINLDLPHALRTLIDYGKAEQRKTQITWKTIFIPKETDISGITDKSITSIQEKTNRMAWEKN
ncbi:MAG: hypothetical protein HXN56_06765 [Prevotella nigrescens]|nr:hypothetical protein [Prevotella nigrescens]